MQEAQPLRKSLRSGSDKASPCRSQVLPDSPSTVLTELICHDHGRLFL
jgi:hypothetical protein